MAERGVDDFQASAAHSVVLRVEKMLDSCCRAIETGDISKSKYTVTEFVDFLETISDAAISHPENPYSQYTAREVLSFVSRYWCSPALKQEVFDVLSLELPTAVSKFAGVSDVCLETAGCVIHQCIAKCNPRDMLSILCEALTKTIKAPVNIAPLLTGLSTVILRIQRHHFAQVKEAVPIIVYVLKAASLDIEDRATELEDLFDRAVGIASSIHEVCTNLEGRSNEKLYALLGLYVLHIMALVSVSISHEKSNCHHLLLQLSHFVPKCRLSYLGLITGADVDKMTSIVRGEEEDEYVCSLTYVKHGASLSVLWGHILDGVAQAAEEDMTAVKDILRSNQLKRWETLGMLKHIFAFPNLPWDLKKHAVNFLLCITDGQSSPLCDDAHTDFSSYMPNIFAALQAITMVIMYTPDTMLRKLAYDAFKRVLADVEISQRFDLLKALIKNTNSSSMIAILIDLVRGELHMERCKRLSTKNDEVQQTESRDCQTLSFWNAGVLELVELVLRPPKGGPPSLPQHGDVVLSALNLYRFVLLTESTGETNYTEVLSKNKLQKAYNEWLLPLRTLLTGVMAENRNDSDELAIDTVCTLNPVELVLYRCIELVEEKLKQYT